MLVYKHNKNIGGTKNEKIFKFTLVISIIFCIFVGILISIGMGIMSKQMKNVYYHQANDKLYCISFDIEKLDKYEYFINNNESIVEKGKVTKDGDTMTFIKDGSTESRLTAKYDSQDKLITVTGKIGEDKYENTKFTKITSFINALKTFMKYQGKSTTN